MSQYVTTTADYWIAPNAISITLNALGDENRIQGSVTSGAVIMCLVKEVTDGDGLGYGADHNPKRWPLSLSPTYFNTNDEKYVYVAIPRSTSIGTQAIVVFPSEKLDIYGRSLTTPSNSSSSSSSSGDDDDFVGAQIGSTDYFYVWLQAVIDEPTGSPLARHWKDGKQPAYGELDTSEGIENKINSGEWYEYSSSFQTVTFLKKIIMGAQSWFDSIKIGSINNELTGVAKSTTVSEYVDSDVLVATPGYVKAYTSSRYLSKTDEDAAAEQIGFLKGLWVKAKGLFGFDANGKATVNSLDVKSGNPSAVTASISPEGNAGLMSLMTDLLRSNDFTAASGLTGNGFRLRYSGGKGELQVDDLLVLGRMLVNTLEIREVSYIGGVYLLTPAGSTVAAVAPLWMDYGDDYLDTRYWNLYSEEQLVGYRLYLLADDGTTATMNYWQQGDMAYCKTFNIDAGVHSEVGNSSWWRLVVRTGTIAAADSPFSDGKGYHYIDVADIPYVKLNGVNHSYAARQGYSGQTNPCTVPRMGDRCVCLGSQTDSTRRGAVQIKATGETATSAAIDIFDGINDYVDLSTFEIHHFAKDAVRMSARKFQWTTADGDNKPPTVYCGTWSEGAVSQWGDEWEYNGDRWLCILANGTTTEAPGATAANWTNLRGANGADGKDAAEVQPNLLRQTRFVAGKMDKWAIHKGTIIENGYAGHNYIHLTWEGSVEDRDMINQKLTGTGNEILSPSTIYTLSFWNKGRLFLDMNPGDYGEAYAPFDRTWGRYVDGVKYNYVDDFGFGFNDGEWTFHVITFKTASSFSGGSDANLYWVADPQGSTCDVCMPKLERGETATAYLPNDEELDGANGNDGNTVRTVTAYLLSDGVPSSLPNVTTGITTDTTNFGNDWTAVPPSLTGVDFSAVDGSWEVEGNTVTLPSPGDGNNKVSRIYFTTGGATKVRLKLAYSTEKDYDFLAVGALDDDALEDALYDELHNYNTYSGDGNAVLTLDVTTAGRHFVCVGFFKDSDTSQGDDECHVTVCTQVYASVATVVNGTVSGSWSAATEWNGKDGAKGDDGNDGLDGWTLTVNPSPLIIGQNKDKSFPFSDDNPLYIEMTAKCGSHDATVGTPTDISSNNMGLSVSSATGGNRRIEITGIVKMGNPAAYVTQGKITCNVPVSYNGRSASLPVIISVGINLIGEWYTELVGDVYNEVASRTFYEYNPETGQFDKTTTIGNYIRSSSQNTATLTEETNGLQTGMSEIRQTMSEISLGVEDGMQANENLVPNSLMEITTNLYGGTACYRQLQKSLTKGKKYTLTVRGCIDSQAKTDRKKLRVYVYAQNEGSAEWMQSAFVEIDSTERETKSVTFTAAGNNNAPYSYWRIEAYMADNGGSRSGTVTVDWVKLEEGETATPWIPCPTDVAYRNYLTNGMAADAVLTELLPQTPVTIGGTAVTNMFNGMNGYRAYSDGSNIKDVLQYVLYNRTQAQNAIEPERYYTLSWWSRSTCPYTVYIKAESDDYRFVWTDYGLLIDETTKVDQAPVDGMVTFGASSEFVRHSVTFCTVDSFNASMGRCLTLWRILSGVTGTVEVCGMSLVRGAWEKIQPFGRSFSLRIEARDDQTDMRDQLTFVPEQINDAIKNKYIYVWAVVSAVNDNEENADWEDSQGDGNGAFLKLWANMGTDLSPDNIVLLNQDDAVAGNAGFGYYTTPQGWRVLWRRYQVLENNNNLYILTRNGSLASSSTKRYLNALMTKEWVLENKNRMRSFWAVGVSPERKPGIREIAGELEAYQRRRTGIDIERGLINLRADRVTFSNSDGTVSGKVSIDPTQGTLITQDAVLRGNLFLPYLRLTSSNINNYVVINFYGQSVINLGAAGNNLQVEVSGYIIRLPRITPDMLGCEINIFNATSGTIEINGSGADSTPVSEGYFCNLLVPSMATNLKTNSIVMLQEFRELKAKAFYHGLGGSDAYNYGWLVCYANINP